MKEAIKELVKSLEDLESDIRAVDESHKDQLKPISEVLNSINTKNDNDQKQFINSIVKLAREVIEVRKVNETDKILGKLTVPPYDLFLPFKAVSDSDDENEATSAEMAVFNKKIELLRNMDILEVKTKPPTPTPCPSQPKV